MLPTVSKSAEETLLQIPTDLKEASLALGVPYYRTMLKVIIPAGISGIMTGVLLGVSRIAGETAPLLFTAFGSQFAHMDIFKPVSALPLLIYNYSSSPFPGQQNIAWGAAFILVVFVFVCNIVSKLLAEIWKTDF